MSCFQLARSSENECEDFVSLGGTTISHKFKPVNFVTGITARQNKLTPHWDVDNGLRVGTYYMT